MASGCLSEPNSVGQVQLIDIGHALSLARIVDEYAAPAAPLAEVERGFKDL
jgi:hypothetical protein